MHATQAIATIVALHDRVLSGVMAKVYPATTICF